MDDVAFSLEQERHVLCVAAYCRVSTKHADQYGSLEHQRAYFERVIENTPDFLSRKQKKNNGEVAMYLVENAHEAIIDREMFDRVSQNIFLPTGGVYGKYAI